jgi:hypothetical protein
MFVTGTFLAKSIVALLVLIVVAAADVFIITTSDAIRGQIDIDTLGVFTLSCGILVIFVMMGGFIIISVVFDALDKLASEGENNDEQ